MLTAVMRQSRRWRYGKRYEQRDDMEGRTDSKGHHLQMAGATAFVAHLSHRGDGKKRKEWF